MPNRNNLPLILMCLGLGLLGLSNQVVVPSSLAGRVQALTRQLVPNADHATATKVAASFRAAGKDVGQGTLVSVLEAGQAALDTAQHALPPDARSTWQPLFRALGAELQRTLGKDPKPAETASAFTQIAEGLEGL